MHALITLAVLGGHHRVLRGRVGIRIVILVVIVGLLAFGAVRLVRHLRARSASERSVSGPEDASAPVAPRSQPAPVLSPTPHLAAGGVAMDKQLPTGRYGISGLLRSEWTKLRTVRSTMWTLGVTVVVGIGISALTTGETRAHWSSMSLGERLTFDPISTSLVGLFVGQFSIGVLGALVMSAEYGTGTIRATFAASPRRPIVLAAKGLVFGAVALLVAEIVAFIAFFLGQALLSAPAVHATLSTPGAWRAVIGSGIYICVLGLFALGLASIIRHTAGAISAYVGVLLVLPLVLQALPSSILDDVRRFLPDRIGATMISANGLSNSFSPWIGLLVMCGYAAAALLIGAVLLVRRDA